MRTIPWVAFDEDYSQAIIPFDNPAYLMPVALRLICRTVGGPSTLCVAEIIRTDPCPNASRCIVARILEFWTRSDNPRRELQIKTLELLDALTALGETIRSHDE